MSSTGNYHRESSFDWFPIQLIGGMLIVVGLILWAAISSSMHYAEERTADYQTCKAKTGDVEWCYKEFQPVLE